MDYIKLIEGAEGEIVEKKSRFIAQIAPVETEEEAYAFIEKIKKKHYDARHNCDTVFWRYTAWYGRTCPCIYAGNKGSPRSVYDEVNATVASCFDPDELYGYGENTIYPEYETGCDHQHGIRRGCGLYGTYSGWRCESNLKRDNRCDECKSAD